MKTVVDVLTLIIDLYLVVLIGRMVVSWVVAFAPHVLRVGGVAAAGLEVIFLLTDPPLHLLRRFLPPLRIGGASIDLAFIVLFILVAFVLQREVGYL